MKEIFETYVENAFRSFEQDQTKVAQFNLNYRCHFPQDRHVAVLDVGIGRGEMLTCMKDWGYSNYLGIDISPSTVNFCSSLGLNCVLIEDTAKWLLQRPKLFAVITLLDVLEHIPKNEVVSFLRSIFTSLIPGGTLIVQVPNLQSPEGFLHRYNDITHEVGFVEHSLEQVLIVSGFSAISFFGFEQMVFPGLNQQVKKLLRYAYWKKIRFNRWITSNHNPKILHPVLSTIASKGAG